MLFTFYTSFGHASHTFTVDLFSFAQPSFVCNLQSSSPMLQSDSADLLQTLQMHNFSVWLVWHANGEMVGCSLTHRRDTLWPWFPLSVAVCVCVCENKINRQRRERGTRSIYQINLPSVCLNFGKPISIFSYSHHIGSSAHRLIGSSRFISARINNL